MKWTIVLTIVAVAAAAASAERTCVLFCEREQGGADATWARLTQVSDLWTRTGAAAPETTLTVMLGLRVPDNYAALHAKFLSVSDPCSPEYRQYWTVEELTAAVAAAEADVGAVVGWLAEAGVASAVGANGDWVSAEMTVAQAEQMFGVELETFAWTGPGAEAEVVRTLGAVSVPAAVAGAVRDVVGLTAFPVSLGGPRGKSVGLVPKVTPQLLYKHYNLSEPAPAGTNVTVAVSEFEGQKFNPEDLKVFQKKFGLAEVEVSKIVGDGAGIAHTEGQLDIEYIMAMAQGLDAEYWLDTGLSFNLVKWIEAVIAAGNVPQVWSTSYGEAIATIDVSQAKAFNSELEKMGTLGVSMIFASGDSGVYSRGESKNVFYPTYPASLPACTAVGATQMDSAGAENSAVDWSGGGFSPSSFFVGATDAPWQAASVRSYLSSGVTLPPVSKYDGTGVGFPDVSALGVDFEVVIGLITEPVSGTSCASPTFAGLIGVVNAHLQKAGKGPLGFLNPLVYSHQWAFNDITQGKNSDGTPYGFEATKGWDPLSGVGTPNFGKILQAALSPACPRTAH